MDRFGNAVWNGGLKDGHGHVSTESGALKHVAYSFSTRFEDGSGTNPEELLAAAHAGCFSMALSGALGAAGFSPDSIATGANVTIEKVEGGFGITEILLNCVAQVPGIEEAQFEAIAQATKLACPVSKLFNAPITLIAKLS